MGLFGGIGLWMSGVKGGLDTSKIWRREFIFYFVWGLTRASRIDEGFLVWIHFEYKLAFTGVLLVL